MSTRSDTQSGHSARIFIKRAYEEPKPGDGTRVLVDRLWPRGVRKDGAHIDLWLKDIAPSAELRRWFNHDPERWAEFQRKYREELSSNESSFDELLSLAGYGPITLVFGAKDTEHNNAVVLQSILKKRVISRKPAKGRH